MVGPRLRREEIRGVITEVCTVLKENHRAKRKDQSLPVVGKFF